MNLKHSVNTITIFLSLIGYGQSFYVSDSLEQKSYKELQSKTYEYIQKNNKSIAEKYIKIYLDKAKKENDSFHIGIAFYNMNWLYDARDERSITVLDSAIYYTRNLNNGYNIALSYNRRALVYADRGDLTNSLSDYLTGLKYAKENKDETIVYIIKHNIAILKRKLGKYEEAKKLFNDCLAYEEIDMINKKGKWDTIHYLQTLAETVSSYRLNKQLDSAKILNKMGIELSRGFDINVLFDLNHGILAYHNHEYLTAKQKLEKVLPRLKDNSFAETYNHIETNLFLGKSIKNLTSKEDAVVYFKKVDSISDELNYFIPENRLAYIELINYYKSKKDNNNQLTYINKLLSADSILTHNYKIVSKQLFDEFDTKELVEEKERIISSLEEKNNKISTQNITITFLLVISLFGIIYYYYRQRLYKKRFLKLVDDQSKDHTSKKSKSKNNEQIISEETRKHLIACLQQFEDSKEFLNPDIDMTSLAKRFNSNSNYLSKVINKHKGKNFTQYINDLRVDYVIGKLKNDTVFRKYTVLALAQEIGFNNSESFSKAFYKNTGIYPSYFIKELLKQ
ncbi:helix-turn-helix domain-containing protein [uncultured Aquimarina sp.]|uniref:helix-turn-helix domain-containing protein n=1 Tax=uncultured Aquimarina sp. TaxID=575652 RepID=UPI002602D3A5|nr:helix-turn-helix domain-containing protein [uncultured Aquimarina sp.]